MSWRLPRPSSALLVALLTLASGVLAQGGERTLVVAPSQPVAGETRTALVIGNGAYIHGSLRNPVNDARAMGKALGSAGFEVILVENATQAGMQRAIRTFGDKISKGGVGLFYYAGHGIQTRGRNYLIPVNADIAREYEIEFGSIDVNLVLAMMDTAKNSLNIVILDACRNNPFARNFRGLQTGLAQIDAPTGTFIAFATAPGSVAADGVGDNGVYTKYLLAEMTQPGVPIELMFKQVRNGVMAETKGQQIPWESSSLRGEFAFRPGVQPGVAEAVAAALRRERDAQQAELQKLQAALDRQQKQLAALGLKPTAAAPVVVIAPPAPVKPVVTASAAPAPTLAASKLPQVGDSWTYRLTEPTRSDGPKQREYSVKVAAVTPNAILDQYTVELEKPGEWAHASGGYIVGLGRSLFAPYLFSIGNTSEYGSIRVQIVDPACSGGYGYICEATARVAGRESVKVPAGTFDTIKVMVEHNWRPITLSGQFAAQQSGARMLTVWYAPAAKRAVKYSSRPTFGSLPPIDTYFDLELASYKLQQPGVAEALAEAAQRDESRRVQAALERQRVQLEALGLRLPEAVKPTPVAAPEPIVTASAAPTITAGSTASRLPKVGDTWTYRLSEPKRIDGPQQRSYTARVAAASPLGILEQYEIDLEKPGEWAHSPGAYVAGLGRSLFAPYLAALGELPASGGLGRIAIVDPACSGAYICEVSARVVGRETIKVPAGSFDAVKVVVDHSWRPMAGGGYAGVMFFGGRTLTVWYVPAVKRAVKYSSQRTFGELPPIDPDFDLELTSYQLK